MRSRAWILFAGLAWLGLVWAARAQVASTKHNLSATGPGTIKAATEREICVFCHAPHQTPSQPLWNHQLSAVPDYTSYWSPTLDAYASQAAAPEPDGASKMCLSCHDGTIALGAVASRPSPIPMRGGVTTLPPTSPAYVGTDLSGSHPISFIVTNALITANNAKDSLLFPLASMRSDADGVRLDNLNKVQCTTCHDPHSDVNFGASGVHFWRKPTWAGVCTVCHNV